MSILEFRVYGVPVPQAGSRAVQTAKGARLITTGGKNLASWRNDLSAAARVAWEKAGQPDMSGPLEVWMGFHFHMPVSRPKRIRLLKHAAKTTKPDLDKLIRSVGDALTVSGVIRDDADIARVHASKVETNEWAGCSVIVSSHPVDVQWGVW